MYTGGLENHPELVARISQTRRLDGNPADVLRAVRDPPALHDTLRHAGFHAPQLSLSPRGIPADGSWLAKPFRGSGGTGIRPWRGGEAPEGCFYQERIAGEPVAAVYVAAGGEAVLLGITRQLIAAARTILLKEETGAASCTQSRTKPRSVAEPVPFFSGLRTGAQGFAYSGSVGPLSLAPQVHRQFAEIGRVLSRHFGLVGLFGVDAVLAGDSVWTIEVNPRYTASVEVLERAYRYHAVAIHRDACCEGRLPAPMPTNATGWYGKAVLYARQDLRVPAEFLRLAEPALEAEWPDLADIPDAGTQIRRGRPITTVLAEAGDERSLLAELERRTGVLENVLYGPMAREGVREGESGG
jgi:predicted ATP-grasp superfamily ATP-dependent carboligase